MMSHLVSTDLSELAYERVKEMILTKKIIAGEKIVQDRLAEDLGISRTPLRAALQKLEGENLVQSIPRRGMVVKKFTHEDIVQIYDCRIALECTAVRLFTKVAEDRQIKALYDLFVPFTKVSHINDKKYQKADGVFHRAILEKCGNRMLFNLAQKGNLMICIDMIGLIRPPEETLDEHLKIIDAISKRDVDLAVSQARSHLLRSQELISNSLV